MDLGSFFSHPYFTYQSLSLKNCTRHFHTHLICLKILIKCRMLIYFGMNLTMREEITVLSLCFIFSALTVPIVIVSSNEYREANMNATKIDQTPMKIPQISTYRDKVFVNVVQIIEEFNQNRTNASDQLTFIKLLNMKPYELRERYLTLNRTTTTKKITIKNDNESSSVWSHFAFNNRTLLTSKSTTIPLQVDW